MGKNFVALFILGMFVLGLAGIFIGQLDLDKVRDGKEGDAVREVFKKDKKDKKVLEVF